MSVIEFPALGWVRGPYPREDMSPVPVTKRQRVALLAAQRRLGIVEDGVLGPQSWMAVADERAGGWKPSAWERL